MTGAFGTACIILVFLVLWVILLNHKIVDKITSLFDSLFSKRGKSDAEAVPEDGETDAGEDDVDEDGGDDDESDDEDEDGENDDEENGDEEEDEGNEPDEPDVEGPELEVIPPVVPVERPEDKDADTPAGQDVPDSDIPPVEVIGGDPTDFSTGLSDEQWKTRYDPRLSLSNYRMPDLSLLKDYSDQIHEVSREELERNNRLIVSTLKDDKHIQDICEGRAYRYSV